MKDASVLFQVPLASGAGTRNVALHADGTAYVYAVSAGGELQQAAPDRATAAQARRIALDVLAGRLGDVGRDGDERLLAASVLLLDRQLDEMMRAAQAREAARLEGMAL